MFGKKPIDKIELEDLYRIHFNTLFTTAQRVTRDAALSEDIIQDFFLHLLDAGIAKCHIRNPEAYFRTSVSRAAIQRINKVRKINAKPFEECFDFQTETENENINGAWSQHQLEDIILCIQKLPDGYRIVLEKHLFDQLQHEEIAEDLALSPSTVRSQYLRGKKRLVQLLEEKKNHG